MRDVEWICLPLIIDNFPWFRKRFPFEALLEGIRFSSAPPGASRLPLDPSCAIDGMLIVLMFADDDVVTPFISNFCKLPGCEWDVRWEVRWWIPPVGYPLTVEVMKVNKQLVVSCLFNLTYYAVYWAQWLWPRLADQWPWSLAKMPAAEWG